MGRFAATLARMLQAMVPPDEMQSQVYMDDPPMDAARTKMEKERKFGLDPLHVRSSGREPSVQKRLQRNGCDLDWDMHGGEDG